MVRPPPKLSLNPTAPGNPVPMMKKLAAKSMVTVTVLPLRDRPSVPKLPVPNAEPPLPCVKLSVQLVVEAHRAADAGALTSSAAPARIEPPTHKADAVKLRNDFRL